MRSLCRELASGTHRSARDRRLTGAIDRSEMAVADVVNVISGEVV